MSRRIRSWAVAWIVATASMSVMVQCKERQAGSDVEPSATPPKTPVEPSGREAQESPDRNEGKPPAAAGETKPAEAKEPPSDAAPEDSKAAADKKEEHPDAAEAETGGKPKPATKPSGVFRDGGARHFLARFEGEVIGRMIWDSSNDHRTGGRLERAERDLFVFDLEKKRFRGNHVERQLTKKATLETMWGTFRDVQLNGTVRLQGIGEEATIKLVTGMSASRDVPYPAPADYHSMAAVASWCAKHRDDKGKSDTFSRPLWFSQSVEWGELAITAEGADPVRMEDGGTLKAWRFRVRFAKTPDVYALVWLDADGRPVRRELPFCGLTFTGCDEKSYDDVAKMMTWETAKKKWQLPDDRMTAEILILVHHHIEKAQAEGSSWGGGLSSEEMIGSEAETEAKLGLFFFFL